MIIKRSITLIIITILLETLGAQVPLPPVPPPPPPGLSIDGFSILLFTAGIVYGKKKILKESSN
jgi:hypothetical protein